uniref:NADH dehydrogenase subunit 6 n=1 Tax=Planaphrodes sahlbergii TaxID=3112131 RepID=UPI002E79873C|nr:NADH dehydrogenase subunit 6 [Planaphrodes sahlbergii]WRK21268.1 NADH dehydrogenase subunit 6 [Planaphrodes sahlbergii]
MKMMMMKMMMILPIMISFMKNPMSMATILLMQTMLMSMTMNKMMKESWFAMITFLMMIGGLLILFMYMSSIASNEKLKFKIKFLLLLPLFFMVTDEMMNQVQTTENQEMLMTISKEKISMMKLYNKKSMMITMMMVMYLLLTMICISKIVKIHEGPLRMKT